MLFQNGFTNTSQLQKKMRSIAISTSAWYFFTSVAPYESFAITHTRRVPDKSAGICRCAQGYTGDDCSETVQCSVSCRGKSAASVSVNQYYCNEATSQCVVKLPPQQGAVETTTSDEDNTTLYIIVIVVAVVVLIAGAVGYVAYAAAKKAKENQTTTVDYMTNQMFEAMDQGSEGEGAGDGQLSVEEFMAFAAKDGRAKPQLNLGSAKPKPTPPGPKPGMPGSQIMT